MFYESQVQAADHHGTQTTLAPYFHSSLPVFEKPLSAVSFELQTRHNVSFFFELISRMYFLDEKISDGDTIVWFWTSAKHTDSIATFADIIYFC